VKDIAAGEASSLGAGADYEWATALGSTLLFAADDGVSGVELWRSDGTADGTYRLRDITPGSGSSNPGGPEPAQGHAPELGGSVLFHARNGSSSGGALWKSDGSSAGTVLVSSTPGGFGHGIRFGSQVLFAGTSTGDRNLWKSNGSEAGTSLIKAFYLIQGSVELGNGVALLTASEGTGVRLYRSNGESSGTTLLSGGVNCVLASGQAAIVNGVALYSANGVLWKSDGTTQGTSLLSDVIVASPEGGELFVKANGLVFFTGNNHALWKSDGTIEGTVQLKPNRVLEMAALNDTLYFVMQPLSSMELWKSDGTPAGTVRVADAFDRIERLTPFAGALYFNADDETHGEELWTSDGTADGTKLVADIAPEGSSSPSMLTGAGDTLFFAAHDGVSGRELWALTVPSVPGPSDAGQADAGAAEAGVDAAPEPGVDAGASPDASSAMDAGTLDAGAPASASDAANEMDGEASSAPDAAPQELDANAPAPEQDAAEAAAQPSDEVSMPEEASVVGLEPRADAHAASDDEREESEGKRQSGCSVRAYDASAGASAWLLGMAALLFARTWHRRSARRS
jgi:ELWxxDGT repeat protein